MAKADWLTISPTSGCGNADVTNSASKYEGREARSTGVTGIAVGVTPNKTYTVVQEGKEEFIEVDSIGSVDADGGTVTITGRSNAKGLTIEALKDGDNVEASVTLSESYTAGGQTTVNGAEIAGDPGATGAYEFAMDVTVGENGSTSVATAIIRITGSDGAQVSATLTQAEIDAVVLATEDGKVVVTEDEEYMIDLETE